MKNIFLVALPLFFLWSHKKKISKSLLGFFKMDIKNVQKRKAKNTFGNFIHFYTNSLKKRYYWATLSSQTENYFFLTKA